MHDCQHGDLDAENYRIHWLEVVIVKECCPENLEAAIEKGTKGTNQSESLVIDSAGEAVLLELIRHVVSVEHVADYKGVEHAKLLGLQDLN